MFRRQNAQNVRVNTRAAWATGAQGNCMLSAKNQTTAQKRDGKTVC